MKKRKFLMLPILGLPFIVLSACGGSNPVNSRLDDMQSQIDGINSEIENLKNQISALRREMQEADQSIRDEYNQKINAINDDIQILNGQLSNLTAQFEEDKANITSECNTKISNLKDYVDGKVAELAAANNSLSQQLSELNQKHETDKQSLQDDYNSKIDTLSTTCAEARGLLETNFKNSINALETQLNTEKQELFDDYTQKLAALSESDAAARQALEDDYNSKLAALETKHDNDKASLQADYNTKLGQLEEEFNASKTSIQNDYNAKIEALNSTFQTAQASLQSQITANKNTIDTFSAKYIKDKADIESDYNAKISNLTATYQAKVAEIEMSITTCNSAISTLQTEMNEALLASQNDYNAKINALTGRVSSLETVTYHTVTFDVSGGSQVEEQMIKHGEKISEPSNPSRPGYSFTGWTYKDQSWVFFGYVVTEDMVLNANWEPIDYTVVFQNDDGTILETQEQIHYGDSVTYHGNIPVKPNPEEHYIYTFNGWDVDITNITGNTIAIAQYIAEYAPYTAYFYDEDDNLLYSTLVKEGETATYVGELPTKADDNINQLQFQFSNWDEIERTSDTITYRAHFESCTRGLIFNETELYQYAGSSTIVEIPAYWNGFSITSISERAFSGNASLTSIAVPGSVQIIGNAAFYNCSSLENVILNEGLQILHGQYYAAENGVFNGCTSLRSISLPSTVTSIGNHCFDNCVNLSSISFSESLCYIKNAAFYGCKSLTSIVLPKNLCGLDDEAFRNCSSLESVEIKGKVSVIGQSAFEDCVYLKSITFPDSLNEIKHMAFRNCSSLESVVLPSSLNKIYANAFSSCSSMESAFIPSSVTEIMQGAFGGCSVLTFYCESSYKPKDWSADWNPEGRPVYWGTDHIHQFSEWELIDSGTCLKQRKCSICNYVETSNEHITNWCFDESIDSITSNTTVFKKCIYCNYSIDAGTLYENRKEIKTISIPNSVTMINELTFEDCSALETITIPSSVNSIGDEAFSHCDQLMSCYFESSTPPSIGDRLFLGTWNSDDFKIFVPRNGLDEYKGITSASWQDCAVEHIFPYDIEEGYNVEFNTNHCKVLVYPRLDLSSTPIETNTTQTINPATGKYAKYAEKDIEYDFDGIRPQVCFKVVCDEGYVFETSSVSVFGVFGKARFIEEDVVCLTDIQSDLQVSVNGIEESTAPTMNQPVGTFFASPQLKDGGNAPLFIIFAPNYSVMINYNGVNDTESYVNYFNKATGEIRIETHVLGNITFVFNPEDNILERLTTTSSYPFSFNGNITLHSGGNLKYWNCDGTTEELQSQFNRRHSNPWVIDETNDDRIVQSTDIAKSGSALRLLPNADDRVSLALKDLDKPFNARNLSFWVYNTGTEEVRISTFIYRGKGYQNYSALDSGIYLPAGKWKYISLGFSQTDIYSFQIFVSAFPSALIFDDICLF